MLHLLRHRTFQVLQWSQVLRYLVGGIMKIHDKLYDGRLVLSDGEDVVIEGQARAEADALPLAAAAIAYR